MRTKNTPYENETCTEFYKNAPDGCAVADAVFKACEKGESFSWADFGPGYSIARREFKRDFATRLSELLKPWL